MSAAAGLGAFGFWMFIAAVVVAGVWFDAKKREMQQETLRRVVESGQQLDPELIDRILKDNADNERPDRDLKVGGVITLSVAPGLVLLGYFLGKLEEQVFGVMLGVALLVGFVGLGLLVAGKMVERWRRQDNDDRSPRRY